jgi:hypothetical protein
VRIVDFTLCASTHVHPDLKHYLQPAGVRGMLGCLLSRCMGSSIIGKAVTAAELTAADGASSLRLCRAMLARFQHEDGSRPSATMAEPQWLSMTDRDALLRFVCCAPAGSLDATALIVLGCMPLFRVFSTQPVAPGSGEATMDSFVQLLPATLRRLVGGSATTDGSVVLRYDVDQALLDRRFVDVGGDPAVLALALRLGVTDWTKQQFYSDMVSVCTCEHTHTRTHIACINA